MGLLDAIVQGGGRRDPEYHYRNGEELCRNGYYLDAIDALDTMLATDPLHAGSWFLKGYALYQSGRYDEAVQSLDRALDITPALHEALTYKGLISSASGRHTEALAFYDRALSLDSDSVKTWYVRGLTLAILERYDEAIRSYERALALEPGHIDALTGISIAMKRRERIKPDTNPSQEKPGSTNHGITGPVLPIPGLFTKPGNPGDAPLLPAPNRETFTNRECLPAGNNISTNEPVLAAPSFRSLLSPQKEEWMPFMPPPKKTAALGVFADHEAPDRLPPRPDPSPRRSIYDEEIARLKGSVAADPLDAEAWSLLGDQYIRTGRYQQAAESYERSLDCDDKSALVWARLGDSRRKTGAYDEALFAYERSLEIATDPSVWLSHARTLVTLGNTDQALDSCDHAISLDESCADAWLYKGFILRKISRHDEAITAYDRVLAINPGHDQAVRQRKSLIDGE